MQFKKKLIRKFVVGWRETFNLDCSEKSSGWWFIVRIPIVRMIWVFFFFCSMSDTLRKSIWMRIWLSVTESKLGKGDQSRFSTSNILAGYRDCQLYLWSSSLSSQFNPFQRRSCCASARLRERIWRLNCFISFCLVLPVFSNFISPVLVPKVSFLILCQVQFSDFPTVKLDFSSP